MKKRLGELIMSALFVIVGIVAILVIQAQISTSLSNTGATTFKTFPTVYGALVILMAGANFLSVLLTGLREDRAARAAGTEEQALTPEGRKKKQQNTLRVACMFILTLAFALLLKRIPFVLLVFVFLFLSFLLLGQKKLWLNAIVSAVSSGVIYVIFVMLLKLSL